MNLVIQLYEFNVPRILDDGVRETHIVYVEDKDCSPRRRYSYQAFSSKFSAKTYAEGIQAGLKLLNGNKNEVPILISNAV